MKPTRPLSENWNWDYCQDRVGRILSDREMIEVSCIWAGQLGHEKCGWCSNCLRPRSLKTSDCDHPIEYIHGRISE